jgi:hypothetical protein
LSVVGSIVAAVIGSTGAYVTACTNNQQVRRLEHIRDVHQAKLEDARPLREALAARRKYYFEIRATQHAPSHVEESFELPTFFPLFLAVDSQLVALTRLANEKRVRVKKAIAESHDKLSDDTVREVNQMLEVLIVVEHLVDIHVLEDTEPGEYLDRVRVNASRLLRGDFDHK